LSQYNSVRLRKETQKLAS